MKRLFLLVLAIAVAFFLWPSSKPAEVVTVKGINFIRLETGSSFLCGSPSSELGRDSIKEKLVQRTIPEVFYLSEFEITEKSYAKIMGKRFDKTKSDLPVSNVSWEEADEFCRKLRRYVSKRWFSEVRLPTEWEWEYAAKSGIPEVMFGNVTNEKLARAINNYNSGDRERLAHTLKKFINSNSSSKTVVGDLPPNTLGFYDMGGNVWEWCEYNDDAPSLQSRPLRGGGFASSSLDCRASNRNWENKTYKNPSVGFRVLLLPVVDEN